MPFNTVPLPLVGVTNKNRSPQSNNQLTKNWYPEVTPTGVSESVLLPWLGSKAFGSSGGTLDRGLHVFNGTLYHVVDQTLYSVSEGGAYTSIGTIVGNKRCIFSNSIVGALDEMVIAAGDVYTYDGTTLTDTGITADSVTYLNSKSIYPATGQVFSVTGASGPATITSTGSAESAPDDLRRPFAFNQWAYMMGVETIEPFYDTGATSGVPLSRIDSAIMQKGLGGFYTVANTDQALYFLADDSNVYKIMQAQLINVTPPYIVNEIRGLNKTAATAFTMVFNGQDFYILRFASGPSFVYIEQIDEWVNLSTDVNNEPYLASSYAKAYDKDIVVDFRTSNTVELSPDTFDELGDVIQRQRVLAPFSSVDLGLGAGKRLIMSKISFSVQTGQGLVSGQGSEPQIMVEYSLDGGETFSEEQWIEFGKLGQFLIKVDYWKMVSFYEITFRITVSDPVFCSLHDASIDVKLDGF